MAQQVLAMGYELIMKRIAVDSRCFGSKLKGQCFCRVLLLCTPSIILIVLFHDTMIKKNNISYHLINIHKAFYLLLQMSLL